MAPARSMDPFRKWLPPALRDGVLLNDSIGGLVIFHFVIRPEINDSGIVKLRVEVSVSIVEFEKGIMLVVVVLPSVIREALEKRKSFSKEVLVPG